MASLKSLELRILALSVTFSVCVLSFGIPGFAQDFFSEEDAGIIAAFVANPKIMDELDLDSTQLERFTEIKRNVVQLMRDYTNGQGLIRYPGPERKDQLREDLVAEFGKVKEFLSNAQQLRASQMALRFRIQARRMQSWYPELDALIEQDDRLGIELPDEVSDDLADAMDDFKIELRELLERHRAELRELYVEHESAAIDLLPRKQSKQFREKLGSTMHFRSERKLPNENK